MQIFVCFFCVKAVEKIGRILQFFFSSCNSFSWMNSCRIYFFYRAISTISSLIPFLDNQILQKKKNIKNWIFEKNLEFLPKTCTDQKWDQIGDQDCQKDFFAGHEVSLFVVVWRQCWIFWVIWTTNFTRRRRFSTPDCSKCPFSEK